MRQPDEIKKGLECCADPECVCDDVCPYASIKFPKCREQLLIDAETLVKQVPKWISAKEPPKEWRKNDKEKVLINYLVYMPEYGVDVGNWIELAGKWVVMGIPANVTHYMPLPEPPKEDVK